MARYLLDFWLQTYGKTGGGRGGGSITPTKRFTTGCPAVVNLNVQCFPPASGLLWIGHRCVKKNVARGIHMPAHVWLFFFLLFPYCFFPFVFWGGGEKRQRASVTYSTTTQRANEQMGEVSMRQPNVISSGWLTCLVFLHAKPKSLDMFNDREPRLLSAPLLKVTNF